MIEREFINQKTKEFYIKKYIEGKLRGAGVSQIKLKKIPLGEKIIIYTSRPSVIVGSKGANIKDLTKTLKKDFNLENPQIEINEVKGIFLDAQIVADRIANSLERFGAARFKNIGHKIMENVINSGALGIELIISGKIPGARAKSWRFYQGYLKKCGDIAITGVRKAQKSALLKSGIVGIKVAIMPPDLVLPDTVEILDEPVQIVEELTSIDEKKKTTKKSVKKKTANKKAGKKKVKVAKKVTEGKSIGEKKVPGSVVGPVTDGLKESKKNINLENSEENNLENTQETSETQETQNGPEGKEFPETQVISETSETQETQEVQDNHTESLPKNTLENNQKNAEEINKNEDN